MARWRSSYAAVCKTVYTGANPVRASITFIYMRGWWNLVDTRDLKSLGLAAVRVQVPLCAPIYKADQMIGLIIGTGGLELKIKDCQWQIW